MNGDRYVLDTNAVIALLRGHLGLQRFLRDATWVGISIISKLEFLVFPNLTDADEALFNRFLERVDVVDLTDGNVSLQRLVIKLRKDFALKLPDAIIVATALDAKANLLTDDQRLLRSGAPATKPIPAD